MLNCEKEIGNICGNCSSCKRSKILQHENIKLVFPLPVSKNQSSNDESEFSRGNIDIITENVKKKSENPFHKIQNSSC